MPLANFSHMLPFLSTSSPPVPKNSHVISSIPPVIPKERPALRICFPLKIQRGHNSWWEYEEFRIQFRDTLMWRQAFRLDEEDSPETSLDDAVDSNLCESSKVGDNAADYNGGEVAFKSHWPHSTSPVSSVLDHSPSGEGLVSKTSSQRLMQLMTRLLSATSTSPSDGSSASSREVSHPFTSSSSSYSFGQYQPPRPLPLNLPSRQTQHPSDSVTREETEMNKIQHQRNITLRKLEGKSHEKSKYMCFSAFRNMFRTHKTPAANVISPILPTVPPLRLKPLPQDQGTIRISSEEWANLRDDILGGITGDTEGIFPFYTESQKAMIMPVEQIETCFRVQSPPQRGNVPTSGVKAALERMEARNWKDVIFVSYDDTPREMKWWYTTREPQVLQWGENMV